MLEEGDKVPAALLRASFEASSARSDLAKRVTLGELEGHIDAVLAALGAAGGAGAGATPKAKARAR